MSTPHIHDGPRSIGALLRIPANALNRRLLEGLVLQFPEMRRSYQAVFQHIDHPPQGTRLTDLADRAQLTKQGLIETIDGMERCGFIERIADPLDRRAKLIRLTQRGMAVHDAAFVIGAAVEREWIEALGPDGMKDLRALLERLTAAVGADSQHGAALPVDQPDGAPESGRPIR